MNTHYSQYPRYQNTESAWTPSIPETWKMGSLRWLSKRFAGGTPDKNKPEYWDDKDIPWLNSGAVNQDIISEPSDFISNEGFANSSAKWIQKESVLIALAGQGKTKGTAAFCEIETTCNQSLAAVTFKEELFSKYFYWFLKSNYRNIRGLASSDGRDGLNLEMLGSIQLPIPAFSEQSQIAKFLDAKTQQIDKLIEQKEKLLKLLAEKRTAIITQAVTKGLNPNVKMKDSGIDWLGEIPEHWKVKKIKYLSPVFRGASPRPIEDPKYFDEDGIYSWVRIADVSANNHYLKSTTQKLSELGSSLSVKLEPSALFLSIAGTVGKPMITKIKCCIHDGFVYFPNLSVNPEFLYRIFESQQPYKGLGKLGTQLNLNTDTVGDISIALPPSDNELISILDFLDVKLKEHDKTMFKLKESVQLLKEYREALITAAITGQIDVREEVV